MSSPERYRVAGYIRLSREDGDKEESDSIGNQRRLIAEYVEGKEEFSLYEFYVDDGYSGTNFERPGFLRMLGDLREGRADCVMVKDLSRFGRDYIETGRYLERVFPQLGIRFVAVADRIDSVKTAYDLLVPIKNIFNEQYARDISKKIQTTIRTKQRAGEFIGAFPSYGYRKSPGDKNRLVVDPYAAGIVRRIFDLYLHGTGKQRIARILNEEGVLCPGEYKRVNGERYRNANRQEGTSYWSYSTVNSILHREMYAGNMVQGTKRQQMRQKPRRVERENWIVVENTHEPIISGEIWERTQSLLEKQSREPKPGQAPNIFAGFLKCGDCRRAMAKDIRREKDGTAVCTFSCGTYRRNGKRCCTPHRVPMKVLEEIVLEDLNDLIRRNGDIRALTRRQEAENRQREKESEKKRIQAELERTGRQKKALYEDFREDLLTREEFLTYCEDYRKREELLKKQAELLRQEEREETGAPWVRRLLERGAVERLDREIVAEMVSQILVYEDHRIQIIYNFSDEEENLRS